jgi:hypothetical protein
MALSRSLPLLAIPLLLQGCPVPGCEDYLLPGIRASIRDSTTGAGITADTRGVVREGTFVDSLESFQDSTLYWDRERAGTYRLEVSATGYQDWARDGIVVLDEGCHVKQVHVVARMKPAAP